MNGSPKIFEDITLRQALHQLPTLTDPLNETFGLSQHARFQGNYADLHARPFPVATTPVRVSHMTLLHTGADHYPRELKHLSSLCKRYSINPPSEGDVCFYQNFGEFEVRWERHTEFSSYTFLLKGKSAQCFSQTAISLLPDDWISELPGEVVAALHIEGIDSDTAVVDKETLRPCFEGQRLIASQLGNEAASVWSALRLHSDGFNRVLLVNRSLNECQTGRLIRTLLELEAYRNMMLLAFPVAQQTSAQVSDMETELADLLRQISGERVISEEREQLEKLSDMAAAVAELIAETRYRFDAARAYYQMVQSRLDDLQETELNGLQTMSAFIEHRLGPAFRTTEATKRRLDDLSSRVDRASDFLRTRVDMAIEAQNQALLQSMDKRAQLQFRLQQTVEGLSIVVITYYVLALCSFIFKAAVPFAPWMDVDLLRAAFLPVVLASVWLVTHRVKKHLKRDAEN